MFDMDHDTAAGGPSVFFLSGAMGARGEWKSLEGCVNGTHLAVPFSDAAEGVDMLDFAPTGAHLVAHGTAVHTALRAVMERPERVRSLTLIDPDIAPALPELAVSPMFRAGQQMRTRMARFAEEGDAFNAAREAVDFFMGRKAFQKSSFELQKRFARRMGRLQHAYAAQQAQPFDLYELSTVDCPTLVVTGRFASSELRECARLLMFAMQPARRFIVPGARAAAHLTDPHIVGPELRKFLENSVPGCNHAASVAPIAA